MKRLVKYLLLPLALGLVSSLANAHDDDDEDDGNKMEYEVNLAPLNGSGVYGKVKLKVKGNTLKVKIKASGLEPGLPHPQHIHGFPDASINSSCPPLSADTNGNGLIEVGEGGPFYGPVILPFVPFNMVDASGNLKYKASFPITAAEAMALTNRAVILHGMTVDSQYIPSLPVACGEIEMDEDEDEDD